MKIGFKIKLLLAIPGGLGFFIAVYGMSKYGPGITHDSAAYVYAAQSLLSGKGYIYFGYGTPFIQWPPLYPTLLAIIGGWTKNIVAVAGYINALIFGFIIYISGVWMYGYMKSKLLAVLGTVAVLLSFPLIEVSIYAWSETLFLLLVVLFLFYFSKFIISDQISALIAASVFAALSCLTRYTGITAIVTGLAILSFRDKRILKKLTDMLIFALASTVPFAVWITRNYIESKTLLGTRTPSTTSLIQNVKLTIATLASWYTPFGGLVGINGIISVTIKILALALIITSALIIIKAALNKLPGKRKVMKIAECPDKTFLNAVPLLCFTVIYTCYLIASATAVAFDPISTRLLSPISVPVILLVFFAVDIILGTDHQVFRKKPAAYLIIVLSVISFIVPGLASIPILGYLAHNGAGVYASEMWQRSSLIEYVKTGFFEGQIYSNYPDAVYLLTGKDARYTPKKNGPALYGLEQFKKSVRAGKLSYIVWFNYGAVNSLYNISDLIPYFDMKEVGETADGTVWIIERSKD